MDTEHTDGGGNDPDGNSNPDRPGGATDRVAPNPPETDTPRTITVGHGFPPTVGARRVVVTRATGARGEPGHDPAQLGDQYGIVVDPGVYVNAEDLMRLMSDHHTPTSDLPISDLYVMLATLAGEDGT